MYLRADHAEHDVRALRRFIFENPLGLLITALPSASFPTLQCTHIPWLLDVADASSDAELGTLRGHLARQNPHAKAMAEAARRGSPAASNSALEHEVTVVFTGPVQSYVTPQFYTQTKPATGKVAPTWNYAAVQVYGRATVLFDPHNPATDAYLQQQIVDLTRHAEEDIMGFTAAGQRPPWEVGDAPAHYVDLLKKSIVGVEIKVDRLEGKFKMSQEKAPGDRQGVIDGFEGLHTDAGARMAQLVSERGALKDAAKSAAAAKTATD